MTNHADERAWQPSISAEMVYGKIWIILTHDGKPLFKVPLARGLRNMIDNRFGDTDLIDRKSAEWGELALYKMKVGKALEADVFRA